jgi:hypothetical protein
MKRNVIFMVEGHERNSPGGIEKDSENIKKMAVSYQT